MVNSKKMMIISMVSAALAIMVCVYFVLTFANYQQSINTYWQNQLKQCSCPWQNEAAPYNGSLTLPIFNVTIKEPNQKT